jgi:N utilization substance protein A
VAKALSPARVREVLVDDEDKQATVVVPDDQLSLAIGREGQNARLAAKLTGWRVDIKSETDFSSQEDEIEIEGADEADGRCAAVLSAGRRCPNASLPGSRYCGLPQHQALARFETNEVTVVSSLGEDEVATLADPDADDGAVSELVSRATAAMEAEAPAEAEEREADEPDAEEAEEPAEAEDAEAEDSDEADESSDDSSSSEDDEPAEPAEAEEADAGSDKEPEEAPEPEPEEAPEPSAEEGSDPSSDGESSDPTSDGDAADPEAASDEAAEETPAA